MYARGFTVWITGPSGAGKTALARAVEGALLERGCAAEVLDDGELRAALAPDLGDEPRDQDALARRLSLVAGVLARNGVAALVAARSPWQATRDELRARAETPFVEVFCDAGDPQGGAHELPAEPEVAVDRRRDTPDAACARVLLTLERLDLIPKVPGGAYTAAEEEEVRRRLKDLGYV